MNTTIQKWGNSLAVRIPKILADDLAVTEGLMVELTIVEGNLVVKPINPLVYDLDELLAMVTEENVHQEIDTGEAVGNEVW
jgi:antitoxin MazE